MKENDKVSQFLGVNQYGETINLEDYRGKKVIVYFYPKASTPGCTNEAISFNELYEEYKENDVVILGVSKDKKEALIKFKEKNGLKFDLISDEDLTIINEFGVWQEKKMCGKPYMGIVTTTFVIDENGNVEKVFDKVNTKTHGQDVLNYLNK